jgi:hypothetical protein
MEIEQRLPVYDIINSKLIQAPSYKVWEVISTPGNLNFCHPFCKLNSVTSWGKVGAEDTIEYYNGLTLKRIFTKWDKGKGYELLIGDRFHTLAKVIWTITSENESMSNLSITISIYPDVALRKYPKPVRGMIRFFYLLPNMSKYLNSVILGFKYHIETGIPVKQNQFGYNRLFSIKQLDKKN